MPPFFGFRQMHPIFRLLCLSEKLTKCFSFLIKLFKVYAQCAALSIQTELFYFDTVLCLMQCIPLNILLAEVLMQCFYWFYQDHTWFAAQSLAVFCFTFFMTNFILQVYQLCPLFRTNWKSASVMWLCTIPTPAALPWEPGQCESAAGPVVWRLLDVAFEPR